MSTNKIDVANIAKLANLSLSDDEVKKYETQFAAILEHIDTLKKANIDDVAATSDLVNLPMLPALREDIANPAVTADILLANAPEQYQQELKVPKVIT